MSTCQASVRSYLLVQEIRHAAAFSTRSSLSAIVFGAEARIELQWSTRGTWISTKHIPLRFAFYASLPSLAHYLLINAPPELKVRVDALNDMLLMLTEDIVSLCLVAMI